MLDSLSDFRTLSQQNNDLDYQKDFIKWLGLSFDMRKGN